MIRDMGERPSAEIHGPNIVIDLKDKKQRVVLDLKGFEFTQEGTNSIEDNVAVAVDKVTKANSASKLPRISQIWYESVFIQPYALPFHELLIRMKNRLFQPSALIDPTTDIGLTLDLREGDILKHLQMGPMEKEQLLSMFLNYRRDQLPDNFMYLGLRYEQKKDFVFESDCIRKFLEAAAKWQTDHAELALGYLKKEGD